MTSYPAAVLWDLDGTLIDTEPYWMECERELVRSFGGQWTDDDAMAIVGFDLLTAAEVIRRRAGVADASRRQIVDHLAAGVLDAHPPPRAVATRGARAARRAQRARACRARW